ncbi:MAG: hypothetical protein ACYC9O_13305 [Candidatus Latescibacterota bacterium]
MKCFAPLFRKDIHRHREEYFVLLFVSAVLGLARAVDEPTVFNRRVLPLGFTYTKTAAYFQTLQMVLLPVYIFAVPALFLYSTVIERISGQAYQAYSLPCRKYFALLSKFITVVFMGTAIFLIGQLIYFAFYPRGSGLFTNDILVTFSQFIFLCGTLCAIEGFLLLIKRNRLLFGMGFFIAMVMLTRHFRFPATSAIRHATFSLLPDSLPGWAFILVSKITSAVYPSVIGLLLAATGLLFTRKYRDL